MDVLHLAVLASTAVVIAVACSPGAATQSAAQAPTIPGGECKTSSPSLRPLVVEWPSSDRLALEAQAARGTVVVHYAGCKLDVLRHCRAPGGYRFDAATRQDDHVAIRSSDELRANMPAYALQLEGKLERAGKLDVDMSLVGALVSDVADVHASMLEGDCAGATHVVSALTVGAFEFGTKADARAGASVKAAGAGASGTSESMKEVLARAGDRRACDDARADSRTPPPGCGAVVRLDMRPISGLSGAGPTRCRIELGPTKCARAPTLPTAFDDAFEHSDVDGDRCEKRAREFFNYCGNAEPVTARFYRNGKVEREKVHASPTRCSIQLRECPNKPDLVGAPFNDDAETASVDAARCQKRADDYWLFCGGGEPTTAQFFAGTVMKAERTASFPTRCQVAIPDCTRAANLTGIFNDAFEGADKDPARCAKRASEWQSWCGTGTSVSSRFFRGPSVEREETATAPPTRCQITLPDCPRAALIAGVFNDEYDRSNLDVDRCMRRSDDWRNHCGSAASVIARFFRGTEKVRERTAFTATRCQVSLDGCPAHPEVAGVFNDTFDTAATDVERCARRASEFVLWCGGGHAAVRFYKGASLEREQHAP